MRPIRVLLLTEIIAPYRIPPFNALAKCSGIDLEVLFFAETEDRRQWRVPKEEIRFRFAVLRGARVGRLYQNGSLFFNPGAAFEIIRNRPDVVICGGWHHPTIWLALPAAKLVGARVLIWSESTLLDARQRTALKEYIKRRVIRAADGFIVPGVAQRDYLEHLGAPAEKIWIAPNAVDTDRFAGSVALRARREEIRARYGLDNRPVVLYVGRLLDEKGLPELLEVAADPALHATFLIVGDGPDADRYRRHCEEHGLGNVRFVGFKEQAELPELYAAADAFVFPTRSDPWGLVLNEAMAAGLAVVCSTAAGAARDMVREGDNGFLYPPGDAQALMVALRRVLHTSGLCERMGARSRELIGAFSPERMAEGFTRAVRSVTDLA